MTPEELERACKVCGLTLNILRFSTRPSPAGRQYRFHTCKKCRSKAKEMRWKQGETPGWLKRLRRIKANRAHAKYPERSKAKRLVRTAIEKGTLVPPNVCEDCGGNGQKAKDGRRAIHAHHEDYSRPLDVAWLCVQCHYLRHSTTKETADERA